MVPHRFSHRSLVRVAALALILVGSGYAWAPVALPSVESGAPSLHASAPAPGDLLPTAKPASTSKPVARTVDAPSVSTSDRVYRVAAVTSPTPARTIGAANVRSSGALGDGTGDDTQAFLRAQDAAAASSVVYPNGPGGAPQRVVYVPPGTYRLLRLPFRSNIRMEIDAGAVLMQAGGRNIDVSTNVPSLVFWDGPPGNALKNVTIIGVGSATGGRKAAADPVQPEWSIAGSFTFDLDPASTNANEAVSGIQAVNVDGFLIQNVFSVQNDSQPAVAPTEKQGWWPQSRKAALGLRGSAKTPIDGSVFYDPRNGTVANWYNIRSPKGFGPNQVNAGHNLSFRRIFTKGGTALRLETDASQGKAFASELRGLRAETIVGKDCNRAVAFAPHAQMNYDVQVTDVLATGCSQGVVESVDGSTTLPAGAFRNSTISNVVVLGGSAAQVTRTGSNGLWVAGTSDKAFAKDPAPWSVVYASGTYSCRNAFVNPSDLIMTTAGQQRPLCT